MEHFRKFWHTLFFILLITTLGGGLALPTVSVYAAPQMQIACGLTMVQWNFDALATGVNSSPNSSTVASDVASASASTGSGLTSPTISTSAPHSSPNSWFASGFASAGATLVVGDNDYFQFAVDTTNYTGVNLSFFAVRSNQGPTTMQVYYSTDGTNFTAIAGTYTINTAYPASAFTADFTGLTNTTGVTYFRIYGWNAVGGGGTGRLDDITFAGCKPATPTPTPTDTGTPTSTSTSTPTGTNTPTSTSTGTTTPTGTPTFTATPTGTSLPGGSATHVVISEFRTIGPGGASDEYVELYNPTSGPIDISGWKINASNSSGGISTRATIPASTLLRSGQYYLIANNNYSNTTVPANLKYGTSISDDGGIGLLTANDQIVDEVGMNSGSAYQEGKVLSPLTSANRSYERKEGDAASSGTPSGSCVDTDDNASDFSSVPPTPHNYSTIRLCNGAAGPSLATTTTTILADSPDPSLVNANVVISVRVTGGSSVPSGKVNITGANTNCTLTLNTSGTGSCLVKFTSTGIKALIATYLGDNTHNGSSDGESHTVATTTTIKTPTPQPTPLPPPPLIGINEFLPRPGHDWNGDGVINNGDEYIELLNHGVIDVNLSGYSLDDEVNVGSQPYRLPSIVLKPGERHVFYGKETGLLLSDGGDAVRLLKPNGQLGDAYNYTVVRFPDQSFCRLPDNGGLDDWNQNCFPTPGLQNSLSGSSVNPPTSGNAQNLCPISDTLPTDFVLAECPPFGSNIWNPAYWDKFGWYDEKNLPESPGKWPIFAE